MVPQGFNLITRTLSWLKHGKPLQYQLATSSGTASIKLSYPLSPPNSKKNTQACVASIQKYSKGINKIAEDTLSPIKFLKTTTNDHMATLRAKGINRQTPRNILL